MVYVRYFGVFLCPTIRQLDNGAVRGNILATGPLVVVTCGNIIATERHSHRLA